MIAEIITVGTEITIGSILNTNVKYLSSRLIELGIEPHYHTSVDDNEVRLINIINIALNRADIIITTGGLGPTDDDITKEMVAKALGLDLIKDLNVESELEKRFQRSNRLMTDNNRKQAYKPLGSEFIINDNGTAPGIYLKADKKIVIMLPGPPKELIPMFEKYVSNLLKGDTNILIKSINTIGLGESALEVELKSLDIYVENFDIATFAKDGFVEIKIIGKGKSSEDLEIEMHNIVTRISDKLGDYIFSFDNISVPESLINNLNRQNLTLSVCESCTGGLITSKITSVAGASKVFDRGIVTYSNQSKIDELRVNPETIKNFGAVSKETAFEMAKGLLEKTNSDIAISTTGIAGPDGGSEEKPVGLVYMCIMTKNKYEIIKNIFFGNRVSIQEKASLSALAEINKFLKK